MASEHYLTALQLHTSTRELELPATAKEMGRELRSALVKAHNTGKITTSMAEIVRRVTVLDEQRIRQELGPLFQDLKERGSHQGAFCIFGGVKNQARDAGVPHFKRNDGAWFDFSITVREHGRGLELLAYDFELRFTPGMGAPFIRFDLNLPDHPNQERELRCHLHPGSDDLLVPAPMMSPSEVLALVIEGARLPDERKRRSPTDFEVNWLRDSLGRAAPSRQGS